ncbi:hypothetical protein [Streptomyces sp. NPDC058595]|uniref:hypothetical protein n=1 Tax=Streptomyces sp. NPDC058595 TaxID=3346550 RepID=UPI00364F5903
MPRDLPRPSHNHVRAAFERTTLSLSRVLVKLGTGVHTLVYTAHERDGQLTVETTTATLTIRGEDIEDFQCSPSLARFVRALAWGMEGSIVHKAMLLVTSSQPGDSGAIVCGWQVTDGWFVPLPREDIVLASTAGTPPIGPLPQRYTAPVLPRPPYAL